MLLPICLLGNFSEFLSSAFFFKINFLQNSFSNTVECQTIWIQIRPDILSGPDLGLNCLRKISSLH